jgi:hypothetical protein
MKTCSGRGDAEGDAEARHVWIECACRCGDLKATPEARLDEQYDQILGQLARMISQSEDWLLRTD